MEEFTESHYRTFGAGPEGAFFDRKNGSNWLSSRFLDLGMLFSHIWCYGDAKKSSSRIGEEDLRDDLKAADDFSEIFKRGAKGAEYIKNESIPFNYEALQSLDTYHEFNGMTKEYKNPDQFIQLSDYYEKLFSHIKEGKNIDKDYALFQKELFYTLSDRCVPESRPMCERGL
ncbi:MAG: hypothetical protein ABIB43_02550 [archaeon]